MSVTFVTAFIRLSTKDPSDYITYFEQLATTRIDILLFLDESLRTQGEDLCIKYPNVRIPEYITLPSLSDNTILPSNRNIAKDTAEYLYVQHSKLGWLSKAVKYTTRPYLAWIDFRIFHVFKDPIASMQRLRDIEYDPPRTSRILAPGCWGPGAYDIWDSVVWRFCGGFLLGPRERFKSAHDRQTELIQENLPRLTWEVNYWTLMEDTFEWYHGDHNDTILPALPENGQAGTITDSL